MTNEDKALQRVLKWQWKKLAKGLCGICGKRKLATKSRCRKCADEVARKARERDKGRKKAGLCVLCGVNPLKTENHCSDCSERVNTRRRERRKERND